MGREFADRVAAFIARHDLLRDGTAVLVGVSGGVDSMVCLSVLRRLGSAVRALHANYGLREGAGADEALVRRWCAAQTPAIPLREVSLDAEARAEVHDESLQEAARVLRYRALARHAHAQDADAVATGHHQDDQAETLLLNLLRGTGPEGLAGMPPRRPMRDAPDVSLIRPLLDVSRAEIEAYAEREGIPWREDPSNRDPTYDRARLRSKVIPLLQEQFPGAKANIARAAGLMQEYVDETVAPALKMRLERAYEDCAAGGRLRLDPLRDEPPVWRRRLILAALDRALPEAPRTAAVSREIAALINAQVGRRVEVGEGAVWRTRDGLRFLPEEAHPDPIAPPVPVPREADVSVPQGTLRVDPLDERPETLEVGTPNVEYADADRLVDPLALRTWREGDRIQPLGLDGHALVSDLLTDAKVPPHRRAGVCLLCTAEHPAWVVGHRLDHRVRVRARTTTVARLTWRPREKASDDCTST
ncbi:MAG: tRNA lysidine(34) synthetase TilS [Salinivenus sp.]